MLDPTLRSPERSQPSSEPTTERTPTAGSNTGGIPPPDPVEYGAGQSGPSVYSPFRLGTEAEGRVAEPGLTIFYRGQFLSRGPWEPPVPFRIHAIAISSHSPAITPLGPSQLAPTETDTHSHLSLRQSHPMPSPCGSICFLYSIRQV